MFWVPEKICPALWKLGKGRLFLARVVWEGFVEPRIFELVLELGRIWTGGP